MEKGPVSTGANARLQHSVLNERLVAAVCDHMPPPPYLAIVLGERCTATPGVDGWGQPPDRRRRKPLEFLQCDNPTTCRWERQPAVPPCRLEAIPIA